mgnify:CR=1 FL=1
MSTRHLVDPELLPLLDLMPPTDLAAMDLNELRVAGPDGDDLLIDVGQIESHITPRTKAIVPVHLFGQCADMEGIMALARKHNLYVIEDNAQAIGADYSSATLSGKSGALGHIGCTSFYPSKNLTVMGDGGLLVTDDDAVAAREAIWR